MKKLQKILAFALTLVMVLAVTGCGAKSAPPCADGCSCDRDANR